MAWSTTLQTGIADSFQLTLGGYFGGTAWQSRMETAVGNVWRPGDALYLFGTESFDLGQRNRSNWVAGAGYRRVLWRNSQQQLSGTVALQHWKFASVKTGANDWLSHENLTYRTSLAPFGLTVTSDFWNLYSSPLPTGSILYTQVWLEHTLWKSDHSAVTFRHGPAHTYSWSAYGADGHRVLRYQTTLGVGVNGTQFEAGFRQQAALQHGIPENRFWHVTVTRAWKHR